MQRGANFFIKCISVLQVFIIIFSVFSFVFIIADSKMVSARHTLLHFWGDSPKPVEPPKPLIEFKSTGTPTAAATGPTHIVSGLPSGKFEAVEKFGKIRTYEGVTGHRPLPDGGAQLFDANNVPIGDLNAAEFKDFQTAVAKAGGKSTEIGSYKGSLIGTGGWGYLVDGLFAAVAVAGAIQLIGGLAGWDESLTNSLSIAAGGGVFAYNAAQSLGTAGFNIVGESYWTTGAGAGIIGVTVAVVIFAATYKKESTKLVNFQCLPYEAPKGGANCEKCNDDPFRPCSEYRCKALGQSCELVNVGSKDEKCVWVNPNDATSPTITPWDTPLSENHRYTSHATRPSSLGTKIVLNGATNGCIKAFTPLTFGLTTNEPAQCKIDLEHKKTLDEMQFFFGNTNLYLYNHTQQFSLPSPDALNTELPELENDGKYDFFVRCRDKNGNENVDEFAVQFCVDPSPDTTAPVIVETSIPTDSFVKFGASTVPLQVYVNEPATCKWSPQDKSYEVMENSMNCATSLTQINARELYTCMTNLTGIVDRQENNFFFRCKDQPTKTEESRNVNVVSYKFNLRGSQPLNIISVAPNGTATGNTNTVPVNLKVVTDDGANEGVAICSFSSTGLPNSYVLMFETNAVEHSQRLDLTTGNYNYKFRCVDYGGNAVEAEARFSVLVDTSPPLVTRAYHDSANGALKIVTNEDASCSYSLNSCNYNFIEGVAFLYVSSSNQKSHYAEWKPNLAHYIKCKDKFGNEPAPNSCSLVASATSIS